MALKIYRGEIPSHKLLFLCIIFLLPVSVLFAGGSGEFSKNYQEELKITFEEVVQNIESGNISGEEAKESLALLRSKYKVEYNDFAGKLDAIIDEVAEYKKGARDAINDFALLEEDLVRIREQQMVQNKDNKTGNNAIPGNSKPGSLHGDTSSGGEDRTGKNN